MRRTLSVLRLVGACTVLAQNVRMCACVRADVCAGRESFETRLWELHGSKRGSSLYPFEIEVRGIKSRYVKGLPSQLRAPPSLVCANDSFPFVRITNALWNDARCRLLQIDREGCLHDHI